MSTCPRVLRAALALRSNRHDTTNLEATGHFAVFSSRRWSAGGAHPRLGRPVRDRRGGRHGLRRSISDGRRRAAGPVRRGPGRFHRRRSRCQYHLQRLRELGLSARAAEPPRPPIGELGLLGCDDQFSDQWARLLLHDGHPVGRRGSLSSFPPRPGGDAYHRHRSERCGWVHRLRRRRDVLPRGRLEPGHHQPAQDPEWFASSGSHTGNLRNGLLRPLPQPVVVRDEWSDGGPTVRGRRSLSQR